MFVVGGEVITASQYMNCGEIEIKRDEDRHDVKCLAQGWAKDFGHNWGGNFVLDICEKIEDDPLMNSLKVVEINSILTSGAYECDMEKVMAAIKVQVERDCGWKT